MTTGITFDELSARINAAVMEACDEHDHPQAVDPYGYAERDILAAFSQYLYVNTSHSTRRDACMYCGEMAWDAELSICMECKADRQVEPFREGWDDAD